MAHDRQPRGLTEPVEPPQALDDGPGTRALRDQAVEVDVRPHLQSLCRHDNEILDPLPGSTSTDTNLAKNLLTQGFGLPLPHATGQQEGQRAPAALLQVFEKLVHRARRPWGVGEHHAARRGAAPVEQLHGVAGKLPGQVLDRTVRHRVGSQARRTDSPPLHRSKALSSTDRSPGQGTGRASEPAASGSQIRDSSQSSISWVTTLILTGESAQPRYPTLAARA